MALQIHSNFVSLRLQKEIIVATYDAQNNTWHDSRLIKCNENQQSPDIFVECCSFSPCGKYLAVCFSKDLMIYSTSDWSCVSSIKTERKGVSVRFFPKSEMILIAEKSGSVKFFKFSNSNIEKSDITLGHNSMLIDVIITDDEQFIITCDRDEKIRVTNYPNTYNIQSYCLGHTQFVKSMNILQSDKRLLVSSSGDRTVRIWEIVTGKELAKYEKGNAEVKECNNNIFTKLISFKLDDKQCLIATLENLSNEVTILKATGNLEAGIKLDVYKMIKINHTPWDIELWQDRLIILSSDKNEPIKQFSIVTGLQIESENMKNISENLVLYWNSLDEAYKRKSDAIPFLFQYKKDYDEADYVESKKIKCK